MVTKDKASLSEREHELLSFAFECMKTKPEIDYDKLATKASLKGAKSARDSLGPILKKLMAANESDGAMATTESGADADEEAASKGKKKAAPRKRKSEDANGDGESPTKKKATPRKGKKAGAAVAEADEQAEEQVMAEADDALVLRAEAEGD